MKNIRSLQEQFSKAVYAYETIKKETESKVAKWIWATNSIYSPEPYYFEENCFLKGRVLKMTPSAKSNKYHYGLDDRDEVIVIRKYTALKDSYYETFFNRQANKAVSHHFDYRPEKEIIAITLYLFKDQLLKTNCKVVGSGWIKNSYTYENGKLASRLMEAVYKQERDEDRTFVYSYGETGTLKTIKEGEFFWYRKPDKALSYKMLSELTENKLFEAIKQNIQAHNVRKKLYCLTIYYATPGLMPPSIGYGTEEECESRINSKDENTKWSLWNPADYQFNYELQVDAETSRLFDLYNQETSIRNKESAAIKIIIQCCQKIKKIIPDLNLNTTEDFVIVVTDYELCGLKRNFKLLNPELYDKFKKILV